MVFTCWMIILEHLNNTHAHRTRRLHIAFHRCRGALSATILRGHVSAPSFGPASTRHAALGERAAFDTVQLDLRITMSCTGWRIIHEHLDNTHAHWTRRLPHWIKRSKTYFLALVFFIYKKSHRVITLGIKPLTNPPEKNTIFF